MIGVYFTIKYCTTIAGLILNECGSNVCKLMLKFCIWNQCDQHYDMCFRQVNMMQGGLSLSLDPMFDIDTAMQVLASGEVSMPQCITNGFRSMDKLVLSKMPEEAVRRQVSSVTIACISLRISCVKVCISWLKCPFSWCFIKPYCHNSMH